MSLGPRPSTRIRSLWLVWNLLALVGGVLAARAFGAHMMADVDSTQGRIEQPR